MLPGRIGFAGPAVGSLLFCCLFCILTGPALAEVIPVDSKGLPLWEIRQFDDFPVRIELADRAALEALLSSVPIASFHREQVRLSRDGDRLDHLIFEPRVTTAEATALERAGVVFQRVPDLFKEARQRAEQAWARQAAKGGDTFKYGERGFYHTHAQIGALFQQVTLDHSNIASDFLWGVSVQGRELWGLVISDNVGIDEAEPEVRLSSTMHGNEPPGMEMLLFLVEYLTDNYGQPGYEDVTYLVDNYEIHFMPLHNPDGYVAGTRSNANGVDLNRNFPEPAGTHSTQETETTNFMNYALAHDFVVSENAHAGALVVNYPWDYTYTLAPDNDALIQLSLEYSTYNLPMYNGAFTQGITNGAQWYVTTGCLQDWSYAITDCIDVTLEIHDTHWPSESLLDGIWEDNRESFMHYVRAARYGVNGIVTAVGTDQPLIATVTVAGIDMPVTSDPAQGDYYKLLDTGSYDLTFSASGYLSQTIYGVSTTWGTPTVLNVQLEPVPQGTIWGVVQDQEGAGLDADIEVRTHPGDLYVITAHSDAAAEGAYSVSMPYGDYKLTVSATGYTTDEEVATASATPYELDFVLGSVETLDLFTDGFENGTAKWTSGWGLADPSEGHDSANSLTDSPGAGVEYERYADSATAMNASVNLTGALSGSLTFSAKWDIENNWDCCLLEISTDGGVNWSAVATGHTHAGSGQGAQQPAGIPVFEGTQSSWVMNSVSLTPWLGESSVLFRFHLLSDSSQQEDGFYFDDFLIQIERQVSTDVLTPELPATRLLAAYPNPFNPQTTLRYDIAQAGSVRLAIYDLQGRLVRVLVEENLPAGGHRVVWDGRNAQGGTASSGVYFARLAAQKARQTVKLVLLK